MYSKLRTGGGKSDKRVIRPSVKDRIRGGFYVPGSGENQYEERRRFSRRGRKRKRAILAPRKNAPV